jgi:hypothetical protein
MQTVTLDVKSVARLRGDHQPRHPLLPPAVLAFTKYWMKLSERRPPRWSLFQLVDARDAAPYITIFKCHGEASFTVEFMGSAVSAMLGEDLTGLRFSRSSPTVAEIDWFERCLSALENRDLHVVTGTANPQYTSKIEYVGADFPFLEDGGDDVTRVVTLTVGRTN